MIKSKFEQRLGGIGLILLSGPAIAWTWHIALTGGHYYRKAAAIPPAFLVLGLGMLLFPIDVDELRAKHGVEKIEKASHVPPIWWVVVGAAVAAGLGHLYALSRL